LHPLSLPRVRRSRTRKDAGVWRTGQIVLDGETGLRLRARGFRERPLVIIDAPGSWGTRPFTLAEDHSSITTVTAIQRAHPFACTWLIDKENRTPELAVDADPTYWDHTRGPFVQKVVFRNTSLPPKRSSCALRAAAKSIVTEVSPADVRKVKNSKFARLDLCDANRVPVGVFNSYQGRDVPLNDRNLRQAFNLAIDRARGIRPTSNRSRTIRRLPKSCFPRSRGRRAGCRALPPATVSSVSRKSLRPTSVKRSVSRLNSRSSLSPTTIRTSNRSLTPRSINPSF